MTNNEAQADYVWKFIKKLPGSATCMIPDK